MQVPAVTCTRLDNKPNSRRVLAYMPKDVLCAVLGMKRKFESGCSGPTNAGFPPRQV